MSCGQNVRKRTRTSTDAYYDIYNHGNTHLSCIRKNQTTSFAAADFYGFKQKQDYMRILTTPL